ncbi:MAG: DUF1015 family protein [Bacteroidales bacterium]
MAILRPFKAYRPANNELAAKIACRPYDVLDANEAKQEAGDNPLSFYHVIKPEIDLPHITDTHSQPIYDKGKENLQWLISQKHLIQDNTASYYIYAQTMWGKTQYGIVGCASVEDYLNDTIKKHELTRPDKEEDRKNHVRVTNFHAEPVFFAFQDNDRIDQIINQTITNTPLFDFTAKDQVKHQVWTIADSQLVQEIETIFSNNIQYLYVADGHHRTAAAAHVGNERKEQNKNHTGNEEYNYFMAVCFPANQLRIIDYNRVVKDLNGLTSQQFISKLQTSFEVIEKGIEIYKPTQLHNFSMYLDGKWYSLTAKKDTYNDNDPIGVLDVTILTEQILKPILSIEDLRTSKRIDFVGGIRGLEELKKRVDSGEMKVAFALYPVSMKQLMDIANTGNIMPPKTTWFEPKLRSGLLLHDLE